MGLVRGVGFILVDLCYLVFMYRDYIVENKRKIEIIVFYKNKICIVVC